MVNNIKNNKISEISANKGLNTLNELKNAEITKKQKERTPKQKELLNLFNDLSDTFLTDETLESKSQEEGNKIKMKMKVIMTKKKIKMTKMKMRMTKH